MYTLQSKRPPLTHDQVLAEARDAGFNTTVFYAYKLADVTPLLDAAKRNGIRAFIYPMNPYRTRTGKWTREEVEPELKDRMSHPALLGWYLIDEPEGIGETSEHTARRFYETIKGIDRDHPCSLVIMSPQAGRKYADAADMIWVDPYPVPDRPVAFVAETVEGVVEAVGEGKPGCLAATR